ncbi:MAG: ParB N-terminal domain-containing protein [Planctomycetes bacterium]|nr:ParB N-terminal domain-containing protein [Planctomycetota bacterium]
MALELELQQLDLRYESLRVRSAARLKKLVASIAEVGQRTPIAVVSSDEDRTRDVVIDGFVRVRAMRRLRRDTIGAIRWDLTELEALLLQRSLRASRGETSLEQAWLLGELRRRFDLSEEELARHFDRGQSWVSRRLALVRVLPDSVQESIREGRIASHAATKYLVPLARASRDDCESMARAIAEHSLSSRDAGLLYAGWRDGDLATRERLLADPLLFLRVRRALDEEAKDAVSPREGLLKDATVISATARRARQRLSGGVLQVLTALDYEGLFAALHLAETEIRRLVEVLRESQAKGGGNARREHPRGDPQAA